MGAEAGFDGNKVLGLKVEDGDFYFTGLGDVEPAEVGEIGRPESLGSAAEEATTAFLVDLCQKSSAADEIVPRIGEGEGGRGAGAFGPTDVG